METDNLNAEQKEAVLYGDGPLLIVAGAGTGKTTVITQRIANLIKNGLAKPEEILAVTFTDKAAGEMEERVDGLLEYGYADLWISTFHSFCERVLKERGLDIGLPTDFKIINSTSAWLLIRQNMDKFDLNYYRPMGNPTKFISALLSHFSHCKDQEVYPDDYLKYAESLKTTTTDLPEDSEIERIKEIANAYHVYQQLLLENSYLDFGDLINYCLKLFKERPRILKEYRDKFKYILVDEFQDTNWSQYELVKILAAPKNNLTVCADDDQAIYRWRGASFSNIVQFTNDFKDAKQISLIQNYRSCQNILDLSYSFIKANDPDRLEFINKINKKLVSNKKENGVIEHVHAKNLGEETREVIKKIIEIVKKDKECSYGDFAILSRSNDGAIPFISSLERAGLPYQFMASRGLYGKPVILDVISYFKLLDNYHESLALYRVFNFSFLEIPQTDIMTLTQYSRRKAKSLYEAISELPLISGISKNGQNQIEFILSNVKKHSSMARERPVSEIMISFLRDTGYLKYLINEDNREKIDLLNQFYKRIKTFEEMSIDTSLKRFIDELTMEIESGEEGKLDADLNLISPDMIKVMTIHGAKGLEFKYVFLVNMVDKRFPTIKRGEQIEMPDALIKDIKPTGDIHLQEERRICYVAMTRAKNQLYFTSADDYGGARKKKLSRFMTEMGYKQKNNGEAIKSEIMESPLEKLKQKVNVNYLPDHLSFSQLTAYEKCPLQYKFNFILKIPVKGKAVFSFGKSIHNSLHDFLRAKENFTGEQKDLFGFENKKNNLDFDYLLELYQKNWIDEWYESKGQKEEYFQNGKKVLKDFYDDFISNPPKILKINGEPALEAPFNLKIGGFNVKGVIDRIDETESGIEIIDYKTGAPKEKMDADGKEQLLIYQIALEDIFKINPIELSYYYVENGTKFSFLGGEKEKQQLKEKIIRTLEEIKTSDFKATPGHICGFCDFKDICDFAER